MFRFVFILTVLFATSAQADLSNREIRQIAYDGDMARMEATFSDLHHKSLSGAISYDSLRSSVSALAVSHPDILAFTEKWQAAYPQSPYANTVRTFQLWELGFGMRGGQTWQKTPIPAREGFQRMQQAGAAMALVAYEATPDFVPATDAVFKYNMTTHFLDAEALDSLRHEVLSRSHDFGSLSRSLFSAQGTWGGEGLRNTTASAMNLPI